MKKKIIDIRDFQETDRLPGAISTETEFSLIDTSKGNIKFVPLKDKVSNNYHEDLENKLFINQNGVVANAFDLKFIDKEEQPKVLREILTEYKMKYPEYEFEIKRGKFPVKVDLGFEYKGVRLRDYATMSTHVLYIKNYGKFIKRPKIRIKK